MGPLDRLRQAWSLYFSDESMDTVVAVILVLSVVYPVISVWWDWRYGGDW